MADAHDLVSIITELPGGTARIVERQGRLTIDVDSADTAQALLLALEQWASHRAATASTEFKRAPDGRRLA